jgi:heme-degrading monooxygenase HmoA
MLTNHPMFIAMNQFRVNQDQCEAFEQAWRDRESFLDGVDGFQTFHLLVGPVANDGTRLYASHTTWRDQAAFDAWRQSEAFRKAHAQGKLSGVIAGPPQFTGWTVVELG